MLRLFDREGRLVRPYSLPTRDPVGSHAYFQLISWSPDGLHLLLLESNDYLPIAVAALDLRTGRLKTVASFGDKDMPTTVAWSPNGQFVALLGGKGFAAHDYTFAVVDVRTGHALLACTSARPCRYGSLYALAWAEDSRSLFIQASRSLDRLDLGGRRTPVFKRGGGGAAAGSLLMVLNNSLVYERRAATRRDRSILYRLELPSGHGQEIFESRLIITAVRPLTGFPRG